jgi:mRNA interferase HigB
MHVISMRRLREFWATHPAAERPLRAWFTRVEAAKWQTFAQLRLDIPSADQVRRLTVFNIAGNRYRLIARVEYERQRIYIRAVLTHNAYDSEKWKDDDPYN